MDTVRYGVHVRNCIDTLTAEISSNTINAYFRGIDLMNNAGSDGISVRDNTLNIDSGASAARGISMTETVFGNGNYKIENNILTLNGAEHGIGLVNTRAFDPFLNFTETLFFHLFRGGVFKIRRRCTRTF